MNKQESRYGFLDEGGDIARRIRSRDWSQHRLGPVASRDAARSGTELQRFTDMVHPEVRPRVVAAIASAIRDDSRYDIDYRIPRRAGHGVRVNAHDKVLARGAGFDHHFVKPVEPAALCAVLDDHVSFNAAQAAAGAQALAPNDL